jgi:hypothetical protein
MATTTINLGLSLDGLSNVDSTGKATGDVLEWNAVTSKWEAVTPSGGGAAGSNGQIQFNNSGAFGADSGLVWDNTNKRLGVGATPSTTVRLDVRAQGALSTDVAFRVRNSANNADLFRLYGNGDIDWSDGTYSAGMQVFFNGIRLKYGGGGFGSRVEFNNNGIQLDYAGNISLGTPTNFGGGNSQIIIKNGTSPTSNGVDQFHLYSRDIVAGNAAPHFRTENGAIIKLYQQSSAGITTVADLVTILQNTGLLS